MRGWRLKQLVSFLLIAAIHPAQLAMAALNLQSGLASWYGEGHRGKPMANGRPFDPDQMTCASWYYPLGAWLVVRRKADLQHRAVVVQVTDRGPARRLVRQGRVIDLSRAAFARLEHPAIGLVTVTIERIK